MCAAHPARISTQAVTQQQAQRRPHGVKTGALASGQSQRPSMAAT